MKKMKKDELELLSYQDIAKLILEDKKKGETTISLFTEICKQLGLSNDELKDKIGDFYTGLTIDKRFIILKDGKWDLKAKHSINVALNEVEEDNDEEVEEPLGEEEEEEEHNETEDLDIQPDDDFEEDELEDLVVVNEEDLNDN